MKKLIIIACTLLFLTGCGMSKEEKEKMFYESLEKAYSAIYTSDGVGLPVYPNETLEIDGKNWYLVAVSKYDKVSKLENLTDEVFESKISNDIKKTINEKYKESDTGLYSISEGGCKLLNNEEPDFDLDENLQEKLKEVVKIKKYGFMNKIVFEYNGKEYTAKKSKDNYVFDSKIFECQNQES